MAPRTLTSRRLETLAAQLASGSDSSLQAQQLAEYEELVCIRGRSAVAQEAFQARRQRVYAAFADTLACAYHVAEQRGGKRIIYRGIQFDEFQQKLGDIDRSESRSGSYHVTQSGTLQLDPTPDEMPDWEDERRAAHAKHVRLCTERGGVIIAAFDLQRSGHQVMVGAVVLDGEWIGRNHDMLDMYFLFASRTLKPGRFVDASSEGSSYRDAGIGGTLMDKVMLEARARGAKYMYISAANSKHTIDFYLHKGARLAAAGETQEIPNSGFAGTRDIQLVVPL